MSQYYKDGLQFSCSGCGYCCREEPGFVFLSNNDLLNLQTYFSLEKKELIDTYCRIVNMGNFKMLSLKESRNNDCIFLGENICQVYKARPLQCRSYPFWSTLMDNEDSWLDESKNCPGIGHGEFYSAKKIDRQLYLRRKESPIQF
ncbi:MAG: YkgJ family cysteine cluster protein [Bacteroidales bacterium]|nr:YkgJ family cysteine cluster protein [Bacteroidales bacterium]